jgi:hypothetical protein
MTPLSADPGPDRGRAGRDYQTITRIRDILKLRENPCHHFLKSLPAVGRCEIEREHAGVFRSSQWMARIAACEVLVFDRDVPRPARAG